MISKWTIYRNLWPSFTNLNLAFNWIDPRSWNILKHLGTTLIIKETNKYIIRYLNSKTTCLHLIPFFQSKFATNLYNIILHNMKRLISETKNLGFWSPPHIQREHRHLWALIPNNGHHLGGLSRWVILGDPKSYELMEFFVHWNMAVRCYNPRKLG